MTLRSSENTAPLLSHSTPFMVGEHYTREQIAHLINLPESHRKGGSWATGYTRWNDAFFIFCNVGTAGRTGHDYSNHWDGNLLHWSGKTTSALHQPTMQDMLSRQYPVHIFWRRGDRAPFFYAGLATPHNIQDTQPVKVTWAFEAPAQRQPSSSSSVVAVREPPAPSFRRGPAPFIGQRTFQITDAETCVYVMRMAGPVAAMFSNLSTNHAVIKVGRSNDVDRRCQELNNGFPLGCLIFWTVVETQLYPTAADADRAENNLHQILEKGGYWLSGEFFAVPETMLPLLG